MEIYIEYILIDNLIINLLIILFTGFLLNIRFNKINIFLANVFGTICAVLLPLVSVKVSFLLWFKLLVAVIMVGLLKKYSSFRNYFSAFFVFLTVTFFFGGLCCGMCELLNFQLESGQVLVNNYAFPVSLLCIVASGYIYLLIWLIKYIKHKNTLSNYYFDVIIKFKGKIHFLRGYLDTGNKLTYHGSGVVLIPKRLFYKEFKDFSIEESFLNPNKMLIKAVNGFEEITVVDADEISIKNSERNSTMQNVKIGLSEADFSSDFDCLIGCEFLMGAK